VALGRKLGYKDNPRVHRENRVKTFHGEILFHKIPLNYAVDWRKSVFFVFRNVE
jgi:hypothetical protein